MPGPERFYKEVTLEPQADGFAVALDGRLAKTAGRHVLMAPASLAEALREEWAAQGETVEMETMPLTRLHGYVLDADEAARGVFVETITAYAGSDLLCYRAEDEDLAARQEVSFEPFLAKAAAMGAALKTSVGIMPVTQSPEALASVRDHVAAMPMAELYARKLLTEITGSAVLALFADLDPDKAFAAARLDEAFQAEKWGEDGEASVREKALRRDYDGVLTYLSLIG